MDFRTWPLSAASTRLLLDLWERGKPTPHDLIARLAIRELMLRGGLRAVALQQSRFFHDSLWVAPGEPQVSPLPAPLLTLSAALGREPGDLRSVVRRAARGDHKLFTQRLRREALDDLIARGLVTATASRRFGLFSTVRHDPTASGEAWAQTVFAALDGPTELDQLGVLVLLISGGFEDALRDLRQPRVERRPMSDTFIWPDGYQAHASSGEFDLFESLDDAFGSMLDGIADGIDASVDALDAALDAVFSSIDAVIDVAVDAGGSDGGHGGGHGGHGGGHGGGHH